ncbi:MAG: hypothetical protein JHD35_05090 [Sphingopyxis sp.]|nr:hypothetical protein [Sphingopyxis sp.]
MRLMDCVASCAGKTLHVASGGKIFEIAGASTHADAVRSCPLRYVLDDVVTDVCLQLLDTDRGMLDPANYLLRVPAQQFWVEWFEDRPAPDTGGKHRRRNAGLLVNAAPDGRSGTIHSFWKNDEGETVSSQIIIEFDLDNRPTTEPGTIRARHIEFPEFQPLLDCMTFRVDPAWSAYFAALAANQREQVMQQCAAITWFDLAFVFAFATVLASKDHIDSQPSDLSRLNRARMKRGKLPLLDHVETRLYLDNRVASLPGENGVRSAPRLHQVRGHLVRRANLTFWRTTHLRGDPATILIQRNVRVTRHSSS